MNIYSLVIGQILRFIFTAGAVYLGLVGVTENQQHELTETLINVFVPIILAGAAQVWSAVNQRYLRNLDPNAPNATQPPSIVGLIAIVALSAVVFVGTGCPSGLKAVREGKEASSKMSVLGKKAIQANIDAFAAQDITLEQFRKLNSLTKKFTEGVKVFRQATAAAELAIKEGADKTTELTKLQALFNVRVVNSFLALADELKLIPGSQAETVRNIIAGVEIAISTVSVIFGRLELPAAAAEVTA